MQRRAGARLWGFRLPRALLSGWRIVLCFFGLSFALKATPLDPDTIISPAEEIVTETQTELPSATGGNLTAVIIFLITLAGGAYYLVWRKRNGMQLSGTLGQPAKIEVEATRALGQRQYLMVARVGDERFLVGTGPQGPRLISALRREENASSDPVFSVESPHDDEVPS